MKYLIVVAHPDDEVLGCGNDGKGCGKKVLGSVSSNGLKVQEARD